MAADFDPNRFSLVTRRLRHVVDPDGALADANRAYDQRYLQVSPSLDGIFLIDGRLDSEGGAMLQTALNALTHPVPGDSRRAEQRRADALVELCRRQLDSGSLPESGRQKPHLSITVSAAALAGMPGTEGGELKLGGDGAGADGAAPGLRRLPEGDPAGFTGPAHRRRSRDPLHPARAGPGAARARRRLPLSELRRPHRLDSQPHLRHWANDGETRLANLALLCAYHHRLVHEGGWRLVREDDGSLQAIPPPAGRRAPAVAIARPLEPAARSG